MRRTGPILRQQKDTCSCWVCRDKKYRETRKATKQEAFESELLDNQTDLEPEFSEIVNKEFWNLI